MQVRNMERQWGDLDRYRGINTSAKGAATRSCHVFCVAASISWHQDVGFVCSSTVPSFLLVAWMR